jgi:Protein of unknown function (DUF1161)
MNRLLTVLALSSAASTSSHALSCDDLKAEIDQKFRAGGITSFTLTIADAASSGPGRVVGTCGNGNSKILYVPAAGSAESRPGTPRPVVLTECKPGFSGPDCKQRAGNP